VICFSDFVSEMGHIIAYAFEGNYGLTVNLIQYGDGDTLTGVRGYAKSGVEANPITGEAVVYQEVGVECWWL